MKTLVTQLNSLKQAALLAALGIFVLPALADDLLATPQESMAFEPANQSQDKRGEKSKKRTQVVEDNRFATDSASPSQTASPAQPTAPTQGSNATRPAVVAPDGRITQTGGAPVGSTNGGSTSGSTGSGAARETAGVVNAQPAQPGATPVTAGQTPVAQTPPTSTRPQLPPQPTTPNPQLPPSTTAPRWEPDTQTQAGFIPWYNGGTQNCSDCARGIRGLSNYRIPHDRITGNTVSAAEAQLSEQEKCLNRRLINFAQDLVGPHWGGRSRSGGQCARGVRQYLDAAGFNRGGGLLHAIDFAIPNRNNGGQPSLKKLGYRNIMTQGMRPEDAPPGTILVFSGPASNEYARTGRHDSTGHTLGHVAVKGNDGFYYTDGKTREAAGRNRTLVGVFSMKDCTNCSQQVKALCRVP